MRKLCLSCYFWLSRMGTSSLTCRLIKGWKASCRLKKEYFLVFVLIGQGVLSIIMKKLIKWKVHPTFVFIKVLTIFNLMNWILTWFYYHGQMMVIHFWWNQIDAVQMIFNSPTLHLNTHMIKLEWAQAQSHKESESRKKTTQKEYSFYWLTITIH